MWRAIPLRSSTRMVVGITVRPRLRNGSTTSTPAPTSERFDPHFEILASDEFEPRVRLGFEFYRSKFFLEDGSVRYFHDNTYPIDTHCLAQSILTPLDLKDLDTGSLAMARSVFRWTMDHMWDERGFFYYRKLRLVKIRTSYMRWTQAWMFLALAALLCESAPANDLMIDGHSVIPIEA